MIRKIKGILNEKTKEYKKDNPKAAGILFCYKIFKFSSMEGSDHPLISPLFDMILILGIIIFLIHKDDYDFTESAIKGEPLKQTYIDKYFRKNK